MIIKSALLVASFLFLSQAQSAPLQGVILGDATHAGIGCPIGSNLITLEKDLNSIQLNFSDFNIDLDTKSIARANCSIAIPITVEKGYKVRFKPLDFYGHAQLTDQAKLKLNIEYFLAGTSGDSYEDELAGPFDYGFVWYQEVAPAVSSSCDGLESILRINISALLTKSGQGQTAKLTLESAESLDGLLEVTECN